MTAELIGDGAVSLFVGPDTQGNDILYASTSQGLYAHDVGNTMFHRVGPPLKGSSTWQGITWNGNIYLVGETILEFNPRNGAVRPIWLDQLDGLPQIYATRPNKVASSLTSLFVSGTLLTGATSRAIFEWDGHGWQVIGHQTQANSIPDLLVSGAYSDTRIWYADHPNKGRWRWIALPDSGQFPKNISGWEYASTGIHKTPWFRPQGGEVDLTALECIVDTEDCTANETVKVEYAVDYTEGASDASYTTLGTITSDGRTIFTFPDNGTSANAGQDFRSIRFKITLSRGGTTTLSPDMTSLALVYRKKLRPKWMHTMDIDLTKPYKGNTIPQLRAALVTAIETAGLVEFTFRNDSGNTRNYYVDLVAPEGDEATGRDESGTMRLTAVEQLAGA